jgi:hypothetical protein
MLGTVSSPQMHACCEGVQDLACVSVSLLASDKGIAPCLQSGALSFPRHTLRKKRVREMLQTQVRAATERKRIRWATLVFMQRQACAFVLNELVLRLPSFSKFLLTGARQARVHMLGQRFCRTLRCVLARRAGGCCQDHAATAAY